jgi:molybdopterin converting factor subunit 1
MRVLLFAGLAEALGCREFEWNPPGSASPATVGEFEAALRAGEPRLKASAFRVAVNQRYAQPGDALSSADEVALIPPVSGG